MPYGLSDDDLWDKESVISYSEGKALMNSTSLEENAAFLVRWA